MYTLHNSGIWIVQNPQIRAKRLHTNVQLNDHPYYISSTKKSKHFFGNSSYYTIILPCFIAFSQKERSCRAEGQDLGLSFSGRHLESCPYSRRGEVFTRVLRSLDLPKSFAICIRWSFPEPFTAYPLQAAGIPRGRCSQRWYQSRPSSSSWLCPSGSTGCRATAPARPCTDSTDTRAHL